jgi:pimeloyl-ACP methyl ester carboxylesterase
MPRAVVNHLPVTNTPVEVEYATFGSPSDPALLLVMGFTAQLTLWPEAFVHELAECGRYVIVFDNRDCGLSTKLDGVEVDLGGVLAAAMAEQPELLPPVPYTLSAMAADAIGLLDHLGIERAHIAGASMGGMIAQTIAIEFPERTESLISIMSSTGDPEVSMPSPEVGAILLAPPPTDREAYIASSVNSMIWHSKKYGDADEVRAQAASDYDRSFYPEGAARQLAAIYASGRRSPMLALLCVPTLVIHGRDDTLIPPAAGLLTAELIDGAHLLLMADMGHDLPEPLWPVISSSTNH